MTSHDDDAERRCRPMMMKTYGNTRQQKTKKRNVDEETMCDAKRDDNARRRRKMTSRDNERQRMTAAMTAIYVQQEVVIAEPIKITFANLLILPTYDLLISYDMQSTVISITYHGTSHKAWHPNVRRPNGGAQMCHVGLSSYSHTHCMSACLWLHVCVRLRVSLHVYASVCLSVRPCV